MRPLVALHQWVAGTLLGCLLVACSAAPEAWSAGWSRPYHDLSIESRRALEQVRSLEQEGDLEQALAALGELVIAHPRNLDLAGYQQDLFLLRAPSEAPLLEVEALARCQEMPRPEIFILAARLCAEPTEAQALLEQALLLDPRCADAHLGMAVLALAGDERYRWRGATESLDRCLALDPGLVGARRLEAWMLSQQGSPAAGVALVRWLDATLGDGRVRHQDRVAAALDLAVSHLTRENPAAALVVLDRLQGETYFRPRRLALLAVAREESGDREGALWAVSAAIDAAPADSLPRVQEALLLRSSGGEAEAEAWDRVLEVAGEGDELSDLIQALRAQVAASRLRARQDAP